MKVVGTFTRNLPSVALLISVLLPAAALADPGNNYCITPPFITAGVKPNLLLMIDNSASMYDLVYQDTAHSYCGNAPTTACTAGTTCSGAATCMSSGTTSTTTTYSAKACTDNSQCPHSSAVTVAKPCAVNTDCPTYNSTHSNSDACGNNGTCKSDNISTPACNAGYCNNCTSANACTTCTASNYSSHDCTSSSTSTFTPTSCTADTDCGTSDTCNNKCNVARQCYDTTYSTTTTYSGYFVSTATYNYDFTNKKFVSGATMPTTCTYANTGSNAASTSSTYFCVNTTGSGTAETVVTDATGFVASGNFLNWLTASKFDIEKQILTGGKYDTVNQVLSAESRGCAGRKFIKAVPGVNLSFGIRGGTPGGISSTQSQAAEYGQTFIDILTGTYNATDCLNAMNDWMNVTSSNPPQLGGFQNDTKGCVGTSTTYGGNVTANSIWNHILHDCYQGMTGGAQGYDTNLNSLEGECQSIYASGITPSAITDPNAGYAVCSSVLTYDNPAGTSWTGYLGACWNGTNFSTLCTQAQQDQRMANYCIVNVNTNPVADPSSTALSTSGGSAPGFILEQGLLNMQPVGSFQVKVALATTPTGLIDRYSDRIRFGAMTFLNNGSGSECGSSSIPCSKVCSTTTTRICYVSSDCPTGETCGPLAKTDGGQIISYVGAGNCSVTTATSCNVDSDCASLTPSGQYCVPSTGSHASGLVNSIDAIPATSWTPFAEAFYNAMGYFARTNDYTASPPTSRSDANFNALPAPNTATSYNSNRNPSQYRCQSNNLLLITDGMSTTDQNATSEALALMYAPQVPNTVSGTTSYGVSGYDSTHSCPAYSGSRSISDLAWVAKNRSIKTLVTSGTASTTTPQSASESITTYVVYSGPQTSSQPGLCDPKTLMTNTATNGGTTLYSASDPASLYTQLDAALSSVAAKAASGTAASILSNSEGSGANILQAVFYPKKIFDSATTASWIGEMQNLWYYVDPYIQNSTIRENTDGDLTLNLINDYVVRFTFDNSSDKTMVQRYFDSNGDSVVTDSDKVGGLIDPDYVKSIWRAGAKLWARSDASSPRTIYTGYNSTAGNTPQVFANDGTFNATSGVWDALQIPAGTNDQRQALASKLINYIRGTDQSNDDPSVSPFAPCLNGDCVYRGRSVTMGVCNNNALSRCTVATQSTDCPGGTCTVATHEWKLGDIISSTPRIESTVRLNTYNLPSPGGYSDQSYAQFINSNEYNSRGMVYVGANDGMLHAFNLGTLSVTASGFQKASLSGTNLGAEQWAFIPQNSLPYLKYSSDTGYSHLYYIDGRTVILDASIGDTNTGTCITSTYDQCSKPTSGSPPIVSASNGLNSSNTWRTVLITGMGLGGASRNDATGVQIPTSTLGYSSYVALDVTDPVNPKFLWEFNNNLLGYATSAPAIVRIGDRDKNGRWFAVFGNGPFGPIDTGTHQFKAQSTYPLTFFVVDLRTGTLAATLTTSINNAFAGTMLGGAIDADRRNPTTAGYYQDDAVYAGYVKPGSDGMWTDGGVVRIMTKEDPNPTHWVVSKVIDGIGPVTTAIARAQDTKNLNLWLYFGTGRYFYRDSVTLDDNNNRRALFGIKEPCYNRTAKPGNALDGTCTDPATGTIQNQTTTINSIAPSDSGWRIDLDEATSTDGAERVVTDTVALTNGSVFFTSFKPNMDVCGYGGNSYLWGVKYDTGDAAPASSLLGKALIQLSTGEFKEVDLSTAFTDKGNRRMISPMTGKPPSDAPPIISNSQNKPVKKILHIQEH